ncbi:MAG: hypothetical protein GEU71_02130 [Actinobacteria bacterium]|nr:hypothetical protein [Actinomycetota bacterium]
MATIPDYGRLGEQRVGKAAGAWGLPDFVYQPIEVDKGGARREVGDRLIWVGNQIAIVQVKTRSSPGDSEDRGRAWLNRHLARANRQINGTYRTLSSPPSDLVLRSDRGVEVPWDASVVTSYCGVVVVDYDRPIRYEPHLDQLKVATIAMVADDWELITSTLISTASLLNYIMWRATVGVTISLGHEDYLLKQVLTAETRGERAKIDADGLIAGRWVTTTDEPSDAVFGSMSDHQYAFVVNEMIAGAAEQEREFSTFREAHEYLHIIEFLDRIPPMHRVEFGKRVIAKCQEAGRTNKAQSSLLRTVSGPLVFVAHPGPREKRVHWLRNLVLARHTQLQDALSGQQVTTLGVATDPVPTAGRSHDYVLLRGQLQLEPNERTRRDKMFGEFPGEIEMFRATD